MKVKTLSPDVSSVDSVVAALVQRNNEELAHWGKENRSAPLSDIARLTYDGRRVRRNHELIDALRKDPRVIVGKFVGVHFADVQITLA